MTNLQFFELHWLYDKYNYMKQTHQHIPNTKKWKFIDDICLTYENSEHLERDIKDTDLAYIQNCIIPGFLKQMTDGEIRTFEFEKMMFLDKNPIENLRKSEELNAKRKEEEKAELERIEKEAQDYYASDFYQDIQNSYRAMR